MSAQNYAGSLADTKTAASEPQGGPSRRSLLRGAAGAGAAGIAAAVALRAATPARAAAAAAAVPATARTRTPNALGNQAAVAGPVVVHLRDARSGEMDVFAGTRQVRVTDPDLAARLTRAVR
jgi:hypothetical protein